MIELVQKKANIEFTTPTQSQTEDLSDYYTKSEVDELLAPKMTKFFGVDAPTSNYSDYPNIKTGDLYFSFDERKMYIAEGINPNPNGGIIIYWMPLPNEADVDNKIEEALAAIGVAEGSEY